MSVPLTTALVLAGGRGERLRPLTDDRPKPMVLVDGVPILEHHLRWLRANGVARAVLLTGYLHRVIHEYFAAPRVAGLAVECIAEETPLGRGGALRNGFERAGIRDEVVVATNGDVLTDQPLEPLVELHQRTGALATLLLTRMVSPFGIVEVDDADRLTSFVEKPALPYWINGGVYVLSRDILALFPAKGDHETTAFPELAGQGLIAGYRSGAYLRSVESPKDLREAEEYLAARGKPFPSADPRARRVSVPGKEKGLQLRGRREPGRFFQRVPVAVGASPAERLTPERICGSAWWVKDVEQP